MTAQEIASLMAEMLDMDDIAAGDNFFDIGGNSILALTLIEKLHERCQARISLLDVIRAPTPARLASLMERTALQQR